MKRVFSVPMMASVLCLVMLLFSNLGSAHAKSTTALYPLDSQCRGGTTVANAIINDSSAPFLTVGQVTVCKQNGGIPAFAVSVGVKCAAISNDFFADLYVGVNGALASIQGSCGFMQSDYVAVASKLEALACASITHFGNTSSGCAGYIVP